MNFLILLGLALAPGVAIILYIYLKDKHEREPVVLLLLSFFYGCLSTLLTLIISERIGDLILLERGDVVDEFYDAMFKVALIEEFSKFVFVRFILYRNKNFNEPFDGIVYSVMVGMGFATLENVLYVFQFGITTGILRMFTAVPAHAVFAILMGYFIGRAKFTHRRGFLLSFVALATATLFHGSYDYFWFIADTQGVWAGIWICAILSLIVGFFLSRQAIKLHQQASPFIGMQVNDATIDDQTNVTKEPTE
jgi:RsiW-degrading membrane proteinase PrsW (M82 family)